MSSFSIDAVWEDTIVFLRRESGLVLPLALATFGVATVLMGLTAPPMETAGTVAASGPQMLWFIPAMLLTIVGNMAISLMVLRGGSTVGESLRTAIGRLPVAVGICLVAGTAAAILFIVAIVIVSLLASLWPTPMTMRLGQAIVIIMLPVAWVTIRLFLMWPMVADTGTMPVAAIRRAFALTRGHALKSLLVIMIFGALYISLISISQLALLPVVRLVGVATGQVELLRLIGDLVTAFIGAVLMTGWTVYLAFTYRRLSA